MSLILTPKQTRLEHVRAFLLVLSSLTKPVMLLDTYEVLNKDLLLNILQMKTKELRETSLILSY